MNVRSFCICRTSESVFEEIGISDVSPNTSIIPIVNNPGTPYNLPARVYPINDCPDGKTKRFLVVYPLLPLSCASYMLGEFSSTGTLISTVIRNVNYKLIAFKSKYNYITNRDHCNMLKEIPSTSSCTFQGRFFIDDIISTPTHINVKGTIRKPFGVNTAALQLFCLNEQMQRIDSNFVLLKPYSSLDSQDSPFEDCPFSVLVPWNEGKIYICLSCSSNLSFSSFEELTRETRKGLISVSDRRFNSADNNTFYQNWRAATSAEESGFAEWQFPGFDYTPLFSIIVPLYQTPEMLFKEMVDSVRAQTYQNWELILVNASPELSYLQELVQENCLKDPRIRSVTLSKNGGISQNTNAGVALAKGDFVSFFDHDDVLDPSALFEYAAAINNYPDIDVLYCDEDKLSTDGAYINPTFKPDFNIDFLCNNNYICHMLTIRRNLLKELTPNTSEYDGAQDHNMTLQAVEKARRIYHVPKILYHWRMAENSTAADPDSKPYANLAGIRSVQDHFSRLGIPAKVSRGGRPFVYRVTYEPPSNMPLVSIIIPARGNVALLLDCLKSIIDSVEYSNYEIILVQQSCSEIDECARVANLVNSHGKTIKTIECPAPFSLSASLNAGASISRGDYLLFIHDDVMLSNPFPLGHLIGACARDDVGAVGFRLFYPDDTIQHAGYYLQKSGRIGSFGYRMPRGRWGFFNYADAQHDVTAVSSACMLTKRDVFLKMDGFDRTYHCSFEDLDYCLRLKAAGLLTLFLPEAEAVHFEGPYPSDTQSSLNQITYLYSDYLSFINSWSDSFIEGDCSFNELMGKFG